MMHRLRRSLPPDEQLVANEKPLHTATFTGWDYVWAIFQYWKPQLYTFCIIIAGVCSLTFSFPQSTALWTSLPWRHYPSSVWQCVSEWCGVPGVGGQVGRWAHWLDQGSHSTETKRCSTQGTEGAGVGDVSVCVWWVWWWVCKVAPLMCSKIMFNVVAFFNHQSI